jgi:hypothetical protein
MGLKTLLAMFEPSSNYSPEPRRRLVVPAIPCPAPSTFSCRPWSFRTAQPAERSPEPVPTHLSHRRRSRVSTPWPWHQ